MQAPTPSRTRASPVTTPIRQRLPSGPWTSRHDQVMRRLARQRVSYGAMAWELNQPLPRILRRARDLGMPSSPYVRGLDTLNPATIRRVVARAWSWTEAGEQLGFTASTVLNWCLRHGVALGTACHVRLPPAGLPPLTPHRGAGRTQTTIRLAGARRCIPPGWTRADVQELMARAAPSVSNRTIATCLGKNIITVGSLRLALKLPPFMRAAWKAAQLDARATQIRAVVTRSWTWQQAATTLQLGVRELQRWCRGHGIAIDRSLRPERPYTPINPARIEQIRAALETGASYRSVAAQIGVTTQYISIVAARLGRPSPRDQQRRRAAAVAVRIRRAMRTAISAADISRRLGNQVTARFVSQYIQTIDPQWGQRVRAQHQARINAARAALGPRVTAALRTRHTTAAELARTLAIPPGAIHQLVFAGTLGPAARRVLRHLGIACPAVLLQARSTTTTPRRRQPPPAPTEHHAHH